MPLLTPFGTTSYRAGRSDTETSLKRYKYVGKERDEETGLYYYGARYYAPWIGRFCSVDPQKEQRSWVNPYNYVQNNPINRTDPTGALDDENDPPKSKLEAIPINDVDWKNFDTENQAILLDEVTVSGGSENTNLVEPPQVLQDNLKDQQIPHVPELDAIWFRNEDDSYTLIDPKKNKQDQLSEYDPNFMMNIKDKLEEPSKSLSGKALKFGGRILYSTIDDVTVSLTNFALVQDIVGLEGAVNLDMTYTTPEESRKKGFSGLMTLGGFMTGLQKEAFKLPGNYSSYAKQANWTKKVNRQIKEFLRKQVYQNVLENRKVTKQASSISKGELLMEKSIDDYNRNSK